MAPGSVTLTPLLNAGFTRPLGLPGDLRAHAPRLGCGELPFETDGTPQLEVGPDRAHQSVQRMLIGSDQQVADFVGDHAPQHTAGIRAGAVRRDRHAIGKHRCDQTLVGLDVDLRFTER